MTRDEVIEHVCTTVSMAYHSIGDFTEASDGFCHRCRAIYPESCFQHSGKSLRYVRDAVVAKLKADGFKICDGFDPETGDELTAKEERTAKEGQGQ